MFDKRLVGTLGAGLATLAVAASAAPAQAAPLSVLNTNNGGAGSLRSAILAAEQTAARDTIRFAIPGNGVHTIALASDLPILTRPLTIRGYSQAGSSPATDTTAAAPTIVIDATNALRGIDIGGDEMDIRGLVIQNAQDTGIYVEGQENVVAGNYVGTDATGTVAQPNGQFGVTVIGQDNVIGGPSAQERNLISGNPGAEVNVTDGTGHVIEGNRIGTNAAGTAGLGAGTGVLLENSGSTVRNNLISGHSVGVAVKGDDNTLQGNYVGTNAAGNASLPNSFGIEIEGGDDNQIGGTGEGEGNVVSGNEAAGIRLKPSDDDAAVGNDVQGNLIGTTRSGRAPLPNGADGGYPGVSIVASNGNMIGGSEPEAGNVISANAGDGVLIREVGADSNRVIGNWIGTDALGTRELGNGGSGVQIDGGDGNRVGDPSESFPMNTITHNGDDGVTVQSGVDNAIVRNSMSDNANLGIDLGANGATANDPLDADAGANDLQNGPEIDDATTTTVDWTLETLPGTFYRLEFYACDGAGTGEGQTFLGSAGTTTDANGNADASTPLTTPAEAGQHVTMTATRTAFVGSFPNILVVPLGTSEFSPCEAVA